MDQQNQSNTKELTFAEIAGMFRGKLKFIICIALIAAIIGAAAGIALSLFSVTYGGDVEFYISPGDNAHRLLPLLHSDSFTEKLLLDEYGLPLDADKNSADYVIAKDAAIAANEARLTKQELVKEYEKEPYALAIIEEEYKERQQKYDNIVNELSIYKGAESGNGQDTLDPDHKAKVSAIEAELEIAKKELDEYAANTYYPAVRKKLLMNSEINAARLDLKEKLDAAEEAAEKLLAPWRERSDIQEKISAIKGSVTYEYAKIVNDDKSSTNVENQNQAFLVVSILVEDNEALANEIINAIKLRLPDYAEKNIEIITGTNEAKCKIVSTFASVDDLTSSSLVKKAVLFSAAAAVIAIVIFCTAVVLKGMLSRQLPIEESKEKNTKAIQ